MKLSEFDFELPEELIAQHPVEKRDTSRLMVVNRTKTQEKYNIIYLKILLNICIKEIVL